MAHKATRRRLTATVAGVGAIALVLSACGSSSTSSGTTSAATSAGGGAASGSAAAGDGSDWCEQIKANWPGTEGTSVNVYTTIVGDEQALYEESLKPFEECTGADVVWEGSKEMEAQIGVRVSSGNPPDTAIFPQPGLLTQIVESSGAALKVPDVTSANVDQWYASGTKDYGTVNGIYFGVPNSINFKSLIWYSPEKFKADGYAIPTTYDELIALSDQIVAAGKKPWCAGIASGEATGWPLTDWLEDYVLRTAGADVYDQWVAGDVKFSDQQIANALAEMGKVIKNDQYVNGGFGDVKTIASTTFQDGGLPILQGTCYLHRQATFYEANWPAGTTVGPDAQVNAFYFPGIDEQFGKPVLVGGETLVAFKDAPAVWALQYYFTSPFYSNERAKLGSWLSSNKGLEEASVESEVLKVALLALNDPETIVRFDASDLMPAPVGSDAEWKQFTAWITGQDDATTLANIDKAWPTS
ncbi:MAG TPA: ABC transporter substrate-binding protein [Nakamurella sp.]